MIKASGRRQVSSKWRIFHSGNFTFTEEEKINVLAQASADKQTYNVHTHRLIQQIMTSSTPTSSDNIHAITEIRECGRERE